MARISLKHGNIEIEVEADDIEEAEETFAKIADGVATGTPTSGNMTTKELYNAISGALKKKSEKKDVKDMPIDG